MKGGGCLGENCGACSVVNTTGGNGDPCDEDSDCSVAGETCNGVCGISGTLCTTDAQCLPTGTNGFCISAGGAGRFNPPAGGSVTVQGGQVSGAGASLFNPFFQQAASTNDWNDVNDDGCLGFNNPPCSGGRFVDQLSPQWAVASTTSPWWMFQYRSVGSVNGFEEFVANQTCEAIPLDVPSEAGLFNQFQYATGGVINPVILGISDNDSGTPVEPGEIEFSFLDVPSRWATLVPGEPKWSRPPLSDGYGANPVVSSSGYVSNLQSLDRQCGTCSGSGDPCTTNPADSRSCPIGETCIPSGPVVSLNQNDVADENTIFDEVAAVVPVAYVSNRGTGLQNLRYSEAQYLFGAGRMPTGENLVAVTRSVGSGTRNAIMNSTGVDTSWGRGDNVGNEDGVTDNFRLSPTSQQTNGGGSSQVEEAIQMWRLAVGYSGLCGSGRASTDAAAGFYEVLGVCQDVGYSECSGSGAACQADKDCPGGETCDIVRAPCNCSAQACGTGPDGFGGNRQVATPNGGFVRPGLNTMLDGCDSCCGYQIVGNGSFVVRGDRDENRDVPPGTNPKVDNQQVAEYLNNIYDSIAAFSGSTQPGNCFFMDTTGCTIDANCPGTFCTGAVVPTACVNTAFCQANVDPASTCEPDFCRLKANMPGDYLANTFFLPDAVDCTQALNSGMDFDATPGLVQNLQNFIRANQTCPEPPAYGGDADGQPAGRTPRRIAFNVKRCSVTTTQSCDVDGDCPGGETCLTVAGVYSDGSTTGSYFYFDGADPPSTLAQGTKPAKRNRLQGDMNQDCARSVADAGELAKAYLQPRLWSQSAAATNLGGGCLGAPDVGNQTVGGIDSAIPELIADFNGDGSLTKEDLRYWMDGLALVAGQLDRRAGAIAIDSGLNALGRCMGNPLKVCQNAGQCGGDAPCVIGDRMLPWADQREQLLIPPAVAGEAPTFNVPADINMMLSTGQPYEAGDFRGDVAGGRNQVCIRSRCSVTRNVCAVAADCPVSAPTAGAQPMGWDGRIDAVDVNYCCDFVGLSWNNLNDAVFMDLSCDMDGDLDVDRDDTEELVKVILEAADGDADLDGDVDFADAAIVQATINDPQSCNQSLSCCWTDGDFDFDGDVDANDLLAVGSTQPGTGDNTCQTTNADTGIPCNTNADCTPPAVCGVKSRYASITPANAAVAGGTPTSIRVRVVSAPQFPALVGDIYYAGPEQSIPNSPNPALRGAPVVCTATPHSQVWTSGVLHLFGQAIVPSPNTGGVTSYAIAHCDPTGAICGGELVVAMAKWGDVVRGFGGGSQPNFGDVNSIVQKFGNVASAPSMPRSDIVGAGNPGNPNTPNQAANFADVSNDVAAFSGFPYPYAATGCP